MYPSASFSSADSHGTGLTLDTTRDEASGSHDEGGPDPRSEGGLIGSGGASGGGGGGGGRCATSFLGPPWTPGSDDFPLIMRAMTITMAITPTIPPPM